MDDINEHKAQGTFSLTAHLEGRGYPTKDVTVFTDADSAFALAELNERMEELANDREALGEATRSRKYKELTAEYDELEAQANALREKVKESRLEFHLRGISPGHLKKIQKDIQKKALAEEWLEDEFSDALSHGWGAPQIISVTNAKGEKDERKFTPEDVEALHDLLPASQWDKLNEAFGDLSFRSHYIDTAVDPGFLQKS